MSYDTPFPPTLFFDPNGRHAHPRTYTHARHTDFLPCPTQLVEKRRHLSRPCATQRVAESDGTAIRIDLLGRQQVFLKE